GGVLVALGLDGLAEVAFQLGEPVVKRLPLHGPVRDLARVDRALVHPVQHGVEDALEGAVARRAAEASLLLEVRRREPALLAPYAARSGVGVERGLKEEIR